MQTTTAQNASTPPQVTQHPIHGVLPARLCPSLDLTACHCWPGGRMQNIQMLTMIWLREGIRRPSRVVRIKSCTSVEGKDMSSFLTCQKIHNAYILAFGPNAEATRNVTRQLFFLLGESCSSPWPGVLTRRLPLCEQNITLPRVQDITGRFFSTAYLMWRLNPVSWICSVLSE